MSAEGESGASAGVTDAPEQRRDSDPAPGSGYWFSRFVYLRSLGALYAVAFLVLIHQQLPLFGEHGLLPATSYLELLEGHYGSPLAGFGEVPTLFWLGLSDQLLMAGAWLGLLLAVLVGLGCANALMMLALWGLYLSFINVGQDFYGFGWESLLLEAGFLAIFLVPALRVAPWATPSPPPVMVIWLLRWLVFRVMFGAGLIKLRGDPCWTDLSCLLYHYETQPNPHALSWVWHQMPAWFHQAGVIFNHLVELLVPWLALAPRRWRHLGGILLVVFQLSLIASGNLSWLNWLTIAVCFCYFDDSFLGRFFPARLRRRVEEHSATLIPSPGQQSVVVCLVALVALLSVPPAINMASPGQLMNTSFEPFRLVNSYGAFGSVGKKRREIVLEGSYAEQLDESSRWQAYVFKCKPGDVRRRPCLITPYHLRLDWHIWFAAMSSYPRHPWLVHFVYKLLHDDPGALSLLESSPFERGPPRHIRAVLYEYAFSSAEDPAEQWWIRKRLGSYMPPVSRDHPGLLRFLSAHGWETATPR